MPAAAIVTLIGTALTVAALAFFLVRVALILRKASFDLGTIIAGLRAIAYQTQPLEEVVDDMNSDLRDVQETLEKVLANAESGIAASQSDSATRSETTVSVLPSSSTYHDQDCGMVTGKAVVEQATLSEIARLGLAPCRLCDPPSADS